MVVPERGGILRVALAVTDWDGLPARETVNVLVALVGIDRLLVDAVMLTAVSSSTIVPVAVSLSSIEDNDALSPTVKALLPSLVLFSIVATAKDLVSPAVPLNEMRVVFGV